MTKEQAIAIFGSPKEMGRALGISRHAIYQWPDVLDQERIDRVVGAALRLGMALPTETPGASDREAAA
jgi:hypothetical protein